MDTRRLYRSGRDKMVAGVCGGLGQFLGIDSTVIRILWALWCLMGLGVLAYLAAALIIPKDLV